MAGSPFTVGGSGTGSPDASQGSLQLSADGRYLLAVDAGSNQISVLRIKPDGSLRPAQGSPVSSDGVDPVSIAVHRHLVYVANAGPGKRVGDTNYTGFRLNAGGHLRPLPGSTYVLPNDSKPGQVLFNRDGRPGSPAPASPPQRSTASPSATDGRLTAAPGSPYDAQAFSPPQGYGQLGSEFSPTHPNQLFVSDAHTAAVAPRSRPRLQLHRRRRRHPHPGRSAGRQRRRRILLDRDQPRRPRSCSSSTRPPPRSPATRSAAGGSLTFLTAPRPASSAAGAEDARLSPDGSTLWVVESGSRRGHRLQRQRQHPHPARSRRRPARSNPVRHRRRTEPSLQAVRRGHQTPPHCPRFKEPVRPR